MNSRCYGRRIFTCIGVLLSVVVFVTFSSFSQQEPIPVVDNPSAQLAEL